MQLGFVIDHSRCIGCHACTVACKSENDVPVGDFRTWVKYTETGEFPSVKRHFAVLRCNQCSEPPCVEICPTNALSKRDDGIVDVDHNWCIGCKSCMQGCPYDALYINDVSGTAEKCHFCAHRTEIGLAPACAVVCPTEAIIPGDFDDPRSRVSQLAEGGELSRRKEEAGTGPNVLYREVDPSGVTPLETNPSGGYLWSNQPPSPILDAELDRSIHEQARARTVYDVPREPLWGWRVSTYLFTKSISAGALLVGLPVAAAANSPGIAAVAALLSLITLVITTALLILDLKRPERFLLILRRPNWDSWLVRGSFALMAHGALGGAWLLLGVLGKDPAALMRGPLGPVTLIVAALASAYTAFLFGQAKGRVLWLQRGLAVHLLFQALIAGAAGLALFAPLLPLGDTGASWLRALFALGLLGHLVFSLLQGSLAPRGRRREYEAAARLLSEGPYARQHHRIGLAVGVAAPLLLLAPIAISLLLLPAGIAALCGLFASEDAYVRAGQALPIS